MNNNSPYQTPEMKFWRTSFALAAITDAIQSLEKLEHYSKSPDFQFVMKPLWNNFVISYSRPFTKSNAIGLMPTKGIVSKKFAEIHNAVKDLRDKMVGHTDPNPRAGDGRQINRLRVSIRHGEVLCTPHSLFPVMSSIRDYMNLAKSVRINLQARYLEEFRALKDISKLPDGDYLFDFTKDRHLQWERCT